MNLVGGSLLTAPKVLVPSALLTSLLQSRSVLLLWNICTHPLSDARVRVWCRIVNSASRWLTCLKAKEGNFQGLLALPILARLITLARIFFLTPKIPMAPRCLSQCFKLEVLGKYSIPPATSRIIALLKTRKMSCLSPLLTPHSYSAALWGGCAQQ